MTARISSAARGLAVALLVLGFAAPGVLFAQDLPDPTRFEAEIQRFEAQDRDNPPPRGAIVLTGSSSITRWNDRSVKDLAPLTIIPRGFGGSVMNDVLHYVDRVVIKYQPRAVVIYEGDNDTDVSRAFPKAMILDQLSRIIARIHEALPETRIYVLAVKPSVRRWDVWPQAQDVNAGYRAIADKDPLVHYVDVASPFLDASGKVMTDVFVEDNLHHNELGTLIWGSAIRAALMPHEARHE